MNRVQKIPFYLPQDTVFDTKQIEIIQDEYISEQYLECGAEICFKDNLTKYVISSRFGNVIKEHIFVNLEDGTFKTVPLYPVMIRTHDLNNPITMQESPILIRNGISNVLKIADRSFDFDCRFLSEVYLEKTVGAIIPDVEYKYFYQELMELESIKNNLELFNNESRPGILFNINDIFYQLEYGNFRAPIEYFGKVRNISQLLIDEFGPTVSYNIFLDQLSSMSVLRGKVNPIDILDCLRLRANRLDNLAEISTALSTEINNSDYVVYAGARDNSRFGEPFELSLYRLYEIFQSSPYTDAYVEYILQHGRPVINTAASMIHNYYLGVYTTKEDVTRDMWVQALSEEIDCLISALEDIPTNGFAEVAEVILQDYHVLIIITSDNNKLTIMFDLIALSLVSKSLIIEAPTYRV